MSEATSEPKRALSEGEIGVALAIGAHLVWGGMAFYFGLLRHISPVEIAVNRGLWSLPVAALIVSLLGQWADVRRAMANPRIVITLAFCSFIIVFNWGFYVWSIMVGRTLDLSLGYFINPLMNVVMGYLFLGERFTRPQQVALALAAAAVLVQTIAAGVFPWLGLMLGGTFCLYGFLRKTIPVGPTQGFFIEVSIIAIPLLLAQGWLMQHGMNHFGVTAKDSLMLIGCGVMTASALMLFAGSVRRIRYSTAGLLQYLSPSLVFLTAVFVFHEPIGGWKLFSFALIWLALIIFSISAARDERNRRAAENLAEDPV